MSARELAVSLDVYRLRELPDLQRQRHRNDLAWSDDQARVPHGETSGLYGQDVLPGADANVDKTPGRIGCDLHGIATALRPECDRCARDRRSIGCRHDLTTNGALHLGVRRPDSGKKEKQTTRER